MFLLQSLQTRGSRGSKRRAAKAPEELESGPESNPVRAFSPGSSCTPLWSPAKGVLQQRCFPPDGGETSGREGLKRVLDLLRSSEVLAPPQARRGAAVAAAAGSLDPLSCWIPAPSGGESQDQLLLPAGPRSVGRVPLFLAA